MSLIDLAANVDGASFSTKNRMANITGMSSR